MSKKSGSLFNMQFMTSCISTTLVLLLLGLVVFFVLTANNLSVYVRENIAFTLVLNENAREADILTYQKELEQKPYIKQSTYISKEQALKEQTEAMGTDPAEFLGYNPFSPSIEIKLNADYANSDSIRWIKTELAANKQVTDIDYPQELLDAVNSNIRKVSLFLLGLAGLLAFISFALINNMIRLTVYSKRFLIHTMKLVGAKPSFIRRPIVLSNMVGGVIAAVIASTLLGAALYYLMEFEAGWAELITIFDVAVIFAALLLTGIVICSIAAAIAANRFIGLNYDELFTK